MIRRAYSCPLATKTRQQLIMLWGLSLIHMTWCGRGTLWSNIIEAILENRTKANVDFGTGLTGNSKVPVHASELTMIKKYNSDPNASMVDFLTKGMAAFKTGGSCSSSPLKTMLNDSKRIIMSSANCKMIRVFMKQRSVR
jgi:hypothetical protein